MAEQVLARLGRLSPTAVFLTATGLVLTALVVGGWIGGLTLLAIGTFPTMVLVRIWSQLNVRARASRLAMIAILMALAVAQILR